jgi:hypothetical protein
LRARLAAAKRQGAGVEGSEEPAGSSSSPDQVRAFASAKIYADLSYDEKKETLKKAEEGLKEGEEMERKRQQEAATKAKETQDAILARYQNSASANTSGGTLRERLAAAKQATRGSTGVTRATWNGKTFAQMTDQEREAAAAEVERELNEANSREKERALRRQSADPMPSSKNKTFERKDVVEDSDGSDSKKPRRKIKSRAFTENPTGDNSLEDSKDSKDSTLKLRSRNKRDRLSRQSGRSDSMSENDGNVGDRSVRASIKFEARDNLDDWDSDDEESLPKAKSKKREKGKRKSSRPGEGLGHVREQSVSEISDEIDGFLDGL